jgi:ATP-dependent Lon protease
MSDECDDLLFQCEPFSGTARLFPLPNLVLFPHVLQPLHVFEPRYRELVEESLAGDRLIAMALLSPGWETDYDGRPPLYPSACLGRIATYHRFEDGRYNLLLAGLQRIRLVRELEPAKSFREAEAVACQDIYSVHGAGQRPALQRCLLDAFRRLAPELEGADESLGSLLDSDLSLGVLTDIVAYASHLNVQAKQRLLEETDVDRRAECLLKALTGAALPGASGPLSAVQFPPDFSQN